MTSHQWQHLGERAAVWPGRFEPLGATWTAEATNFAVRAPAATAAWVCLFDDDDQETRHPLTEQTLGTWHGAVPDLQPGTRYGFRVDGPWDPAQGLRFNPAKLLLDPYARAVSGGLRDDAEAPVTRAHRVDDPRRRDEADSAAYVPKGVVLAPEEFDWAASGPGGSGGATPWSTSCTSRG